MLKRLWRKIAPNPLDSLLKTAQKRGDKRILIFWNRGLGDIALGLYAIVHRIRFFIPDAKITFLTRPNLKDGFTLLGGVDLIVAPELKRGQPLPMELINPADFDLIIPHPDPTYWVSWQRGQLTPKLNWNPAWDKLCQRYPLAEGKRYIGAHVQTESNYASWRDWPQSSWEALFKQLTEKGEEILLFGFAKTPSFNMSHVIDLRGETPLFDLLSIIKNRCKAIVVPDSGISSMTYYLDLSFPLKIVSLWADPNNGILKQNVASPNPLLRHFPLIGSNKQINRITPDQVEEALFHE